MIDDCVIGKWDRKEGGWIGRMEKGEYRGLESQLGTEGASSVGKMLART